MIASAETYPGVAYSVAGDVVIILWTGDPSLAANRWLIEQLSRVRLSRTQPALGLQIIAEQAGTPDADARRYIQEAFKHELVGLRRFVNTPLGSSFKQSLVRTILRGMALVGDRTKVMVIASNLEQALDLLAEKASPDTPSRDELRARIAQLFDVQGIARSA